MLHCTRLVRRRGTAYGDRVMCFPHRRKNALYLGPKQPHRKSPLANKDPEDYSETWNQRTGIDWYNRLRGRNEYRHWPWVTWKDDPMRQHKTDVCRRTFSALTSACVERPQWNLYELVGQDYRLPNRAPVSDMAPIIAVYTARYWSASTVRGFLDKVEQTWPTIGSLHANLPAALDWNRRTNTIPNGLMVHVEQLVNDIVLLNQKKAFRLQQQESGILRMNNMERYFALPYLRSGPAMPARLEQPTGVYPRGKWSEMNGDVKVHPSYVVDQKYARGMYPA